MRARDQCSIFSTGGKFRPNYGLLLELHALTLVTHSYELLVLFIATASDIMCTFFFTETPWNIRYKHPNSKLLIQRKMKIIRAHLHARIAEASVITEQPTKLYMHLAYSYALNEQGTQLCSLHSIPSIHIYHVQQQFKLQHTLQNIYHTYHTDPAFIACWNCLLYLSAEIMLMIFCIHASHRSDTKLSLCQGLK